MYNIKKARKSLPWLRRWNRGKITLPYTAQRFRFLFFIKADLAEKHVFSFTHVKRKSSL